METEFSTALDTLKTDPGNPQALEAIARLHPGNGAGVDREAAAEALSAARSWHAQRGEVQLCVQLLDAELAWTPTGAARADLLVERALLLHQELLRWEPARDSLKEALEAAPDHKTAAQALAALESEEAGWQELAQARLAQAKDAGNKSSAASSYVVAGELYLKFRPKSQEGEAFLKRSLELDLGQRRADMLLERLYRDVGRTDDLMELYRRRISAAGSAEDQAAADAAAGALAEQLGKHDQAVEHYKHALQAFAADPRSLKWMDRTLGADKKWPELVKLYEAALKAVKRGPAEIPILLALGRLHHKDLGQLDQAEAFFRRVKKANPVQPEAIDFYRAYHTQRDELPQLISILGAAQKAEVNPEARIRLGIEMAEMAELRPQSLEKAIDAWKGLLKLRPALPEAVAALRRLYTKTEKWNALLELLKDAVEALPPTAVDDKVARYLDLVPIYRDRLRLEVMVINTYVAILSLKPDHPEALAALAERYEAQGRWGDLVQIFTRQAEAATDLPRKVALWHRVAQLWSEKFNKQQNAIGALEKLLLIAPGDEKARTALRDIHVRGRSWKALVELMRREAALLEGAGLRAHLVEMAKLCSEKLADARLAIGAWNEVLGLATDDVEALAALAGLYEREKRWAALAEVLSRQAAATSGPAAAALLEKRGVLLYEKLGAGPAALQDLKRVQVEAPENTRVVRMLRDIYAEAGQFEALEALYAERPEELCDVLAAAADRSQDPAAAVRLLQRVAELSETRLKQPERALKAYEQILATEPGNLQAARAAVDLYRSTERWPRLLATFEILLGASPPLSDDERLRLMNEARSICESKLGSKSLAFQWCARAYELAPTDDELGKDLERLAGEADEWDALGRLYALRLEARPADDERLQLLRRSLRVSLTRLDRPVEARRWAEEILAISSEDEEAVAALQRVLLREEKWPDLVEQLRKRLGGLDKPARIERLLRIARLEEEKIGDRTAAAKTLREVVDLEPGDARALRALGRVLEAGGDTRALAEVLKRQAEIVADDERAALWLRLGRLFESELSDVEAAREAYLRTLETDAISAEAVAGLERLVEAKAVPREQIGQVSARLAPYYELTEKYDKWARTLETLVSVAEDDDRRMPHLELLARLYAGPLDDSKAAYRIGERMFEIDPHVGTHREALLQMAASAGALADLAAAVRRVLDQLEAPVERRELLGFLADVEDKRGRAAETEAVYRELLTVEPLHGGAFRALVRRYQEGERWSDLRELLGARQKDLPDPKERGELLVQIAEIDESLLEDRAHAIETWRALLELEPADGRAWRALDRLYQAAEKWQDLDDLLGREAQHAGGASAIGLKRRKAEVRLARFDDPAGALDLLEDVLQAEPTDAVARGLLERILDLPDYRQRAAALLEPVYEATENWGRLVSILNVQREARQGIAGVDILTRVADLQEQKLQSRTGALITWRQVMTLDPNNMRALGECERLTTLLERYTDLVELYQELARKRDREDISGAAALLAKAARIYLTRFGDRAAAVKVWRQVLDLDPTNRETAGPAAEALEALHLETGDFRGLIEVLRAKLEWTTDTTARISLFLRIATLEEKGLQDVQAAVVTYRALLESEGDNLEALAQLERIFEATGQHRDRVEILGRRATLATDPAARRELRFRIAATLERELGDVDEAIAAVRALLDEAAEDRTALQALARLYQKKGAPSERMEILERQLVLAATPADRVEFLRQIAELLSGPLERPGEAFDRWREILALAPRDAMALGQIEAILGDEENTLRPLAAETLEPLYQSAGDWPKLARVVEVYVEAAQDGQDRVQKRVRLADIQERQLGDRAAAFHTLGLAISDAQGEAELPVLLDGYERLAAHLGPERGAEVVALYRTIEPDVLSDDVRVRLQRTIAAHAERAGDPALAGEYFRKVLERLPDDPAVLVALEGIYQQTNDLAPLNEIVLKRAELASGDGRQELPLRLQAAALAVDLGRPREAIAAFERVWELEPGHGDAFAALEQLYEQAEEWGDLARLLERRLELGMSEREAVGFHSRLARLQLDRLDDQEAAMAHLAAVLAGDADNLEAISLLEKLQGVPEVQAVAANLLEPVYVRRSNWTALVGVHKIRLEQTEDPESRLDWAQRIAQLYEEQIEDLDEAFNWYGRVFRERPTDRRAQEQLVRLAPKLGRWKELSRLLDDYLDGELGNSDETLQVVRLAAWVYDEAMGERETALKYYRRYVEAQPGDLKKGAIFERALERWEAWLPLRDFLEEEASHLSSPEARIQLLRRSARLSEERLEARGEAIATLNAILELDPGDARAAEDLDRLLHVEERWGDLREHLLTRQERATEVHVQDQMAMRLGDLEETRLGEIGAAIERYGEVLNRTPDHPGARGALEALIANDDYKLRAAQILEPFYRKTQDARQLVEVLTIRLESIQDTDERTAMWREIASFEEHLGRLDRALEARGHAWLEDVSVSDTLGDLEALATATKRFPRFAELLASGVEMAGDPDLQASLSAMRAKILELRIADPAQAIEAWRETLAARSDDQEAFAALERLLAGAGRHAELCEILGKHIEITREPAERATLTKRTAVLYEQVLKLRDEAVEAWRAVLELDDSDEDALDALIRLYIADESWRSLLEIYLRKIELAAEPETIREFRFIVARLHDEKLEEPFDAASQLKSVLQDFPGDLATLEMLDRIYAREKQHAELLEVLDLRAASETDPAEREAVAFRAARLMEMEIGEVPAAVDRYKAILGRTPRHAGARDALWTLARGEDHGMLAIPVLDPVLRAGGEWGPLVDLQELRLKAEDAVGTRLEVLADVARVEEEQRRDPARAFGVWARAFAEEPGDLQVGQALERLAEVLGDHDRLARVYEDKLRDSYDAELQKQLATRLAELHEERLGSPARAVEFWNQVRELGGDDLGVLARIEGLLRGLGRDADLEEVLAREAEVATDQAVQADFFAVLADLRYQRLANLDGALEAYRAALDRVPTHQVALAALRGLVGGRDMKPAVLDILEPLAEQRGDFAEVTTLLEARLVLEEDGGDRASLLRRIADLAEHKLGNRVGALEALGRALREEPTAFQTADEVERVSRAAGVAAEGARWLEAVLDALEDTALSEMALKAARLYEEATPPSPDHEESAERLYERVLKADAENAAALGALEHLYRRRGDSSALARVLERRGALEMDADRRRGMYAEAARLHEERGELDAAIAAWRAVRESDETHTGALDELARLYEAQGKTAELVQALEERVRFEDHATERAALWVRIGELKVGALNDLDGAAAAFREALDAVPTDPVALRDLAGIEERRGDFAALEEALSRRLAATTGAEHSEVLFKLAENSAHKLKDPDRALSYLHQVLDAEPTNRQAFVAMEQVLHELERWHDLVELLERRAEVEGAAGQVQAELTCRAEVAEIWANQLGAPDNAIEALEKILAREPHHLPSLLALARIHEAAERWSEARGALDQASALVAHGPEAAEIHYRLGRIAGARAGAGDEAEAQYLAALECDPGHAGALGAVEDLARTAGNNEHLVQVLERRAQTAVDEGLRKTLLTEIASLHTALGRPAQAVPAFEQLAKMAPADLALQESLGKALVAAGRVEDGERVLVALIDQMTRAKQNKNVARLQQVLGSLAEGRGALDLAEQRLQAAYQIDPTQAATLAALGRVALRRGDADKVRRFYRSLLLHTFDEKVVGITKAEVYLTLGKLHADAGEIPKARNMFERGLETEPQSAALKQALAGLPR